MLTPTILKLLNEQITHELRNRNIYLAMRGWFNTKSLAGFTKFMDKQADGEREHADKFMSYVQDHKDLVEIGDVTAPKSTFKNALEALEAALTTEKDTTAKIKALYQAATKENDFATQAMLDWFVTEQVEEETVIRKIIDKLEGVAGAYAGLLIIDQELS